MPSIKWSLAFFFVISEYSKQLTKCSRKTKLINMLHPGFPAFSHAVHTTVLSLPPPLDEILLFLQLQFIIISTMQFFLTLITTTPKEFCIPSILIPQIQWLFFRWLDYELLKSRHCLIHLWIPSTGYLVANK